MKISIITVVLNDIHHIEKTILSVINQTEVEWEYIIIDGGSVDGTADVIRQYEKNLVYWISEPDEGVADAFNKGLSCTSGDIVAIVNSGDYLEAEALRKVSDTFKKGSMDVIYGNVQYWLDSEKEYIYKAEHTLLPKFMSLNHPAVFVSNKIYKKFGVFDKHYKIAMDYELMLRFYLKGAKFQYIDAVLSNMRLGGLSDIGWRQAYREAYEIRKRYLGSSMQLYLMYLFQVFKRLTSNTLERFGLGSLKKWYRQFFSPIHKALA